MNLQTAIMILEHLQKWRQGKDVEMVSPKLLTTAIDVVLKELNPKAEGNQLNTNTTK